MVVRNQLGHLSQRKLWSIVGRNSLGLKKSILVEAAKIDLLHFLKKIFCLGRLFEKNHLD